MIGRSFQITLTLLGMSLSIPAFSHHSFLAQYNDDTSVRIEGVVTEVWYQNPHARVYVEVTGGDGETVVWETETYPRNILVRRGWRHDDLHVGDDVVVMGRRARDGGKRLQIITITRPSDGWQGIGYSPDSID